MSLYIKWMISALICSLLASCANVVTPAGGPKDEIPPKLIVSEPPNYSVRFNGSTIQLTFDEFIAISDVFQQVIVSPPMDELPEFKIKRKNLIIELKDSLKENLTYTINFGESIKDITEANVLRNFQYVFATGDLLDSLQIRGKVKLAETLEAAEGVYLMLYPSLEDSIVYKEKPYYFAISDKEGNFLINNIAEGKYKLFALKDQNFNYLFDLPNEQIGFLDSAIIVDTLVRTYELKIFEEEISRQALLSARSTAPGKVVFAFDEVADDVLIVCDSSYLDQGFLEFSTNRDTVTFWTDSIYLDSLVFTVSYDTVSQRETVKMKSIPRDSNLVGQIRYTSNLLPFGGLGKGTSETEDLLLTWELNKSIRFRFASPIEKFFPDSISLYEDSAKIRVEASVQFIDSIHRLLEISYPWNSSKEYELVIPANTLTDMFGQGNASIRQAFKTKPLEDYGMISFNVNLSTDTISHIFQLMDNGGKLMREVIMPADSLFSVKMEFLKPGTYRAQIIQDDNQNGKWDPGNYLKGRQAEKVIQFDEIPALRANWELDFDWEVN